MSTLASSRPQPLKLTIPSLLDQDQDEEESEEERRRSGSSSSRRRSSTEVAAMHPDCLPLPLAQHGGGNSPQVREEDCDPAEDCEEQLNIEDEEEEADQEEQDLDLEDPTSCCSETSVLSVGQEQSQAAAQAQAHAQAQVQAQARQRLLISQIYRPSAFSSATTVITPPADALQLSSLPDDLLPSATTVGGGSSFQEEFLRKSQLYAEELMKQQMHLMAAARVNALTAAAAGKQLQMAAMAAAAAAVTAPSGQDALAQLTATALGLGQAPHQQLLLQRDQVHHHHHHHLQNHHNNNENLHERALKFSIDNILKADFGSRLPKIVGLGGNSASGNATGSTKNTSGTNGSRSPLKVPKKGAGKPLNLAQSNAVNPSLSFSSSLANICSNSNDSNSTATSSSTNNTSVAPVDLVKSPPPAGGGGGGTGSGGATSGGGSKSSEDSGTPIVWPAWVYCTRYSDRPSSGRSPRTRKPKKPATSSAAAGGGGSGGGGVGGDKGEATDGGTPEDKRPRTAFSGTQLARLKHEFNENRYLTEKRRQQLSGELGLNEAQIKIWFQNKRAKLKKSSGTKNPLALQLMAQGLYNHSTVPLTREEEEMQELQEAATAAAASKEAC